MCSAIVYAFETRKFEATVHNFSLLVKLSTESIRYRVVLKILYLVAEMESLSIAARSAVCTGFDFEALRKNDFGAGGI